MSDNNETNHARADAVPVGSSSLVGADEDLHAAYLIGYHKRDKEIRGLKRAVERLKADMQSIATLARNDSTSVKMLYRTMRDIEHRAEESLKAATAKGDSQSPFSQSFA